MCVVFSEMLCIVPDAHAFGDRCGRTPRNVDIVESRRNGPQLSTRHDDDDDSQRGEQRALRASSPYGWLMTHYGWLAGLSWFLRRRPKIWRLTADWRMVSIINTCWRRITVCCCVLLVYRVKKKCMLHYVCMAFMLHDQDLE